MKEQWVVAKYAWRGFLAENVFEEEPSRALKAAAASGSLRDVVAAKARGGDPNWRDEGLDDDDGRTALHAAAAAGRADVVAFLLLNGAALDDEVHALAAVRAACAHVLFLFQTRGDTLVMPLCTSVSATTVASTASSKELCESILMLPHALITRGDDDDVAK